MLKLFIIDNLYEKVIKLKICLKIENLYIK